MTGHDAAGFAAGTGMLDLASERMGGRAIACSDERFAGMGNLLLHAEPRFSPETFGNEGQLYSGWESGRNYRRTSTHEFDWCIVKLGAAGVIDLVDVDTSFFKGNYPALTEIEAAMHTGPDAAVIEGRVEWSPVLGRSPLKGHSHNYFAVKDSRRWNYLRLKIHPDGGVARLRVYGTVSPDYDQLRALPEVELSAALHGGLGVAASDMFYSSATNLLMPGRAANMGQAWETARKRGAGHNWAVVSLGLPGRIKRIEVDTNFFKHNAPPFCSVDALSRYDGPVDLMTVDALDWRPLLPKVPLAPHAQNFFDADVSANALVTHVRLNIFPDGGVSRLRLFGAPE